MNVKTKTQSIVLTVLVLLVVVFAWVYNSHTPSAGSKVAGGALRYTPLSVESSRIHWDRLESARATEYKPGPRDIFNAQLPPPEPANVRTPDPEPVTQGPPEPPPLPPLQFPLKFFGYGRVESGSQRRAFLSDSDTVYIVGEGEYVLGRFRIVKINRTSLEFEEISTGRRGSAALEDQGPGN